MFIHGMGAAVNRAVNLALQIESKFLGTVQLSVNTSTTTLVGMLSDLGDNTITE